MGEGRTPPAASVEYSTPWFDLVSKSLGHGEPYYALRMIDYVCIVALTPSHDLVLVRQYRPAVERHTLELPAGHVEKNQTPEQAARTELADETGFISSSFELLGTFFSDTGRNENRTWCYFAADVHSSPIDGAREEGIETILAPASTLGAMILGGEFNHGPHIAAVMLAALRQKTQTILGVGNGTMNRPRKPVP